MPSAIIRMAGSVGIFLLRHNFTCFLTCTGTSIAGEGVAACVNGLTLQYGRIILRRSWIFLCWRAQESKVVM
jgi:hypothetical protein